MPYITDIYLPCADSESGDLRFLPFEGCTLDQPYMSMNVVKLIQLNYRINAKRRLDEQMKSTKGKRR